MDLWWKLTLIDLLGGDLSITIMTLNMHLIWVNRMTSRKLTQFNTHTPVNDIFLRMPFVETLSLRKSRKPEIINQYKTTYTNGVCSANEIWYRLCPILFCLLFIYLRKMSLCCTYRLLRSQNNSFTIMHVSELSS